jgi:uncharacterized low-complexity protein
MEALQMSQKTTLKPLTLALGAAFVTSLAGTSVANAAENPFAMSDLSSGYMVAEMDENKMEKEGKCGGDKKTEEGKCGGDKKTEEGKCGGDKKTEEGKCGGDKTMEEGQSDGEKKTDKEGNCGEGKCGGDKK